VVSDPGVIAAGWVADVEASLQALGIEYCLYSAVSPNPRVEEVMLGADLYRENHCDVIVAVGGSPMDCGKGIGIVAAHGRSILEFEGADTIRVPAMDAPCILTNPRESSQRDVEVVYGEAL
jgi:alcohol dehydrogenase class IV